MPAAHGCVVIYNLCGLMNTCTWVTSFMHERCPSADYFTNCVPTECVLTLTRVSLKKLTEWSIKQSKARKQPASLFSDQKIQRNSIQLKSYM